MKSLSPTLARLVDPATTSSARSAAASSGGGQRSTQVGGYAPETRPTSRQHQLHPPKQAAPALHSALSALWSTQETTGLAIRPFFVHRRKRGMFLERCRSQLASCRRPSPVGAGTLSSSREFQTRFLPPRAECHVRGRSDRHDDVVRDVHLREHDLLRLLEGDGRGFHRCEGRPFRSITGAHTLGVGQGSGWRVRGARGAARSA